MVLPAAKNHDEFLNAIDLMIEQFRLFIEEQGGWSLLWRDTKRAKPEEAVQLLFRGIVQNYCKANNISIDREVEIGRGPVDFKFSTGYHRRAMLEIKKLDSGAFWNGLEDQLPTYMKGGEIKDGFFLAVRYTDSKTMKDRVAKLPGRVKAASKSLNLNLRFGLVDARKPVSASKIKPKS